LELSREDLPNNAREILAAMDKYSYEEIAMRASAVFASTPSKYRPVFSVATKKSWTEVYSDVESALRSREYERIHQVHDQLVMLGNVDNPGQLAMLSVLNHIAKDPKLEAYIFYRTMGGKARVKLGFLRKI
jgi:hypothetical protein